MTPWFDEIDAPPERIRLWPAPGTATAADVQAIADREDRLYELIDGILVEKVMDAYASEVAGLILYCLHSFLNGNRMGHAYPGGAAFRILEGQIRIPDVSFISKARRGKGKLPPIPRLVPNLAVEVISKGNTKREMTRKLKEYFEAGVELV